MSWTATGLQPHSLPPTVFEAYTSFLQAAVRAHTGTMTQVADRAVCSLHKSSTRSHLSKVAAKHPRVASAAVIAELRFDLPAAYAFHRLALKRCVTSMQTCSLVRCRPSWGLTCFCWQ